VTSLKRSICIASAFCVILAAQSSRLAAQTSRDSYRRAYSDWRQKDPKLEHDLTAPNANPQSFAERVENLFRAVQRYGAEHVAFLRASAEAIHKKTTRFAEPVEIDTELTSNTDFRAFIAGEIKSDEANLKVYAKDRSRAITQIRQALDRERAALVELNGAMDRRYAATSKATAAQADAERARAAMAQDDTDLNQSILEASALANQEFQAWVDYYQQLASLTGPPLAPVAAPPPPAPAPASPYSGTWTFPETGSFTGPKPEFADLAVHEEKGLVKGSFYARFRLPSGKKGDPTVRFDFSGPVTAEHVQRFALKTTEGEGGYVELTQGRTPSELEVSFHAALKPGRVQQADLVMLKR
jgi:hypothetical protein